jgi:hypothetical protein
MKILLLSAGWCGMVTLCWLIALATLFTTPALWLLALALRRLKPWLNL